MVLNYILVGCPSSWLIVIQIKKKLFVRSFLIWPIIYRKVAAQSGFRVFVTIRDRRNEIGGTWIHTGSFSLCATVIIKAAGLGSVHKRRFFSKYFSVPNLEDVEITGKITLKKSRWVFCDIRNNQRHERGKCYQPSRRPRPDNTYRDLDYSGYHKKI